MLVVSLICQPPVLEEGIELPPTENTAVNLGGEIQRQNARSFTKPARSF